MALAQVVKFNSQTNGRDKLCRFLQYASKFSYWYVERAHLQRDLIEKFKALQNSFSATRKVLRLGKSIDLLVGAYRSLAVTDLVIKLALVLAKINQAVYLIVDHRVWLIKLGILKGDAKAYASLAAKFWLVTIIFNLIRNTRDLLVIINRHKTKSGKARKNTTAFNDFISNKPMVIDTVKNVSDVFLPLAGLHYINISVGLQGLLGMLSSIMAMLQSWDPKYKLLPA